MLKVNAREVMDRLCAFWKREMPDRILASISTPSPRQQELVRRRGWDTQTVRRRPPVSDDLDSMLDYIEAGIEDRAEVLDDSLPGCNPNFGYGDYLFGGLLGAELRFFGTDVHTWSEMAPLITDWSQLDDLRFDRDSHYARKCIENLRHTVQHADGRYSVGPVLGIDGMNLAVMLRGATQAYLDVYDHPDELKSLMAFGTEFNLQFLEMERAMFRQHNERAFDHLEYSALSIQNNGMSMSVDAYDLCDVWVYRQMGFEYHRDFIERAGRAYFHIHGDGWHLVDEVAKLPGLNHISIQDDEQGLRPRPFCQRAYWRQRCGDLPIAIECTEEELLLGLETRSLPGGVMYLLSAGGPDKANALMEKVWAYRAPDALCACQPA